MLTEQLPNNNARLVSTSLHRHLLHSHHLEIPTALQPAASGDKLLSKYPQIQHAAIQAHLSHKATLYACCRFENQTLPISDWKKNPKCFDLKTLQRNKTESSGAGRDSGVEIVDSANEGFKTKHAFDPRVCHVIKHLPVWTHIKRSVPFTSLKTREFVYCYMPSHPLPPRHLHALCNWTTLPKLVWKRHCIWKSGGKDCEDKQKG